MSDKKVDISEVKELVEWLNVNQEIQEFSLKYGDLEIALSRNAGGNAMGGAAMAQSSSAVEAPPQSRSAPVSSETPDEEAAVGESAAEKKPGTMEAGEGEVLVRAPMVGTFYASPKPGAPAFVEKGQAVEPSSVLCIIEVMKLMSNIEAKVEGTIKEIYVEDQQPVEYGQPLMLITKK